MTKGRPWVHRLGSFRLFHRLLSRNNSSLRFVDQPQHSGEASSAAAESLPDVVSLASNRRSAA